MKMVQKQNLEYLHTRSHFSYPYFQFMKQLLIMNYNFTKGQIDTTNSPDAFVRELNFCSMVNGLCL